MFVALPIMGRLSERFGARMISGSGAAIALLGTVPFALAGPQTPLALLCVALFVRGFGVGRPMRPSSGNRSAAQQPRSISASAAAARLAPRRWLCSYSINCLRIYRMPLIAQFFGYWRAWPAAVSWPHHAYLGERSTITKLPKGKIINHPQVDLTPHNTLKGCGLPFTTSQLIED